MHLSLHFASDRRVKRTDGSNIYEMNSQGNSHKGPPFVTLAFDLCHKDMTQTQLP